MALNLNVFPIPITILSHTDQFKEKPNFTHFAQKTRFPQASDRVWSFSSEPHFLHTPNKYLSQF